MNNPTNKDVFGVVFFRFSDQRGLNPTQYFDCLRALEPLLRNRAFEDSTSGFYINYITNSEGGNSIRLTYFTNDDKKTMKEIEDFCVANPNISLFSSADSKRNEGGNAISGDAAEELRFRIFSNVYTHIGLDLLDPALLPSFLQILASYMSNFLRMIQASGFSPEEKVIDAKSFFGNFFNKNSGFFKNELSDSQKEQLWKDLAYCSAQNICFPHFFDLMFCSPRLSQNIS